MKKNKEDEIIIHKRKGVRSVLASLVPLFSIVLFNRLFPIKCSVVLFQTMNLFERMPAPLLAVFLREYVAQWRTSTLVCKRWRELHPAPRRLAVPNANNQMLIKLNRSPIFSRTHNANALLVTELYLDRAAVAVQKK